MKSFKEFISELTLTPPTDFKRSNFSNPQPMPKGNVGASGNIKTAPVKQLRKIKTP